MDYEKAKRYKEERIHGWLILFGIGVVLAAVPNLSTIIKDFQYFITLENPVVIAYYLIACAKITFLILTMACFLQLNRKFRLLYVLSAAVMLILNLIYIIFIEKAGSLIIQTIVGAVLTGLWIFYLFLSKRVRYAFGFTELPEPPEQATAANTL